MNKIKPMFLLFVLMLTIVGCASKTDNKESAIPEETDKNVSEDVLSFEGIEITETDKSISEKAENELSKIDLTGEIEDDAHEEQEAYEESGSKEISKNKDFVDKEKESEYEAPKNEISKKEYCDIPDYSGQDVIVINDGIPYFEELITTSYEKYSSLDSLGRCGPAEACIRTDIMPAKDEQRGSIEDVRPSGWIQAKYDMNATGSDSPYLWNRCHLIGWQLAGENANEKNLITGTRHINVDLMLPYENLVADAARSGLSVMYRATPVYNGTDLVAKGIQLEGFSVEDLGFAVCFNVFCYNVQPSVDIDYSTGKSTGPEFIGTDNTEKGSEFIRR